MNTTIIRRGVLAAAATALFGAAGPQTGQTVIAHHSFAAEFDENKPVKITGKLTSMRWSNPHGWIYLDVTTDGKVVNWAFETSSVNALFRAGWRKEDLPVGATLTVDGWQARNGTPTANAYSITFQDGKRLFAGSPAGAAGTPAGAAPSK
jgi:hypothetical protein